MFIERQFATGHGRRRASFAISAATLAGALVLVAPTLPASAGAGSATDQAANTQAANTQAATAQAANAHSKTATGQAATARTEAATNADRSAEAAARTVDAFATRHGALGVFSDRATGQLVVRVPAESRDGEASEAELTSAGASGARVVRSHYATAAVAALLNQVKARAWHTDANRYAYAFRFDADRDAVVVTTNAPTGVAQPLREAGAVVVADSAIGRLSRSVDGAPHRGGASITDTMWTCTSGFTVKNGSGTKFMVTAGHCFELNKAVRSTGGGGSYGTVTKRAPFPQTDLELLGGASYQAQIYTGDSTGVASRVVSAADPVVGDTVYCHSGQTTYEHCGDKVTSVNGQFCDNLGCTENLIEYRAEVGLQAGDSGSPFYLSGSGGVQIRGVNIAGGSQLMWAEKWSTVASRFGVSIAT